jgi:hypothetical protein
MVLFQTNKKENIPQSLLRLSAFMPRRRRRRRRSPSPSVSPPPSKVDVVPLVVASLLLHQVRVVRPTLELLNC